MIEQLKKEFPLVNFERVGHFINSRSEDASYPSGMPKPERIEGDFIRLENPMGGADIVSAANIDAIRRLAAWHQARAIARGFGA